MNIHFNVSVQMLPNDNGEFKNINGAKLVNKVNTTK